ncbi:hypothetical protein P7F88_00735 [Vibrio hannami]|nr:hypothetical protein [Vibrio hannami]MDG3084691.1 hypothetical protein [Vibrio hannami]
MEKLAAEDANNDVYEPLLSNHIQLKLWGIMLHSMKKSGDLQWSNLSS